MGGGYGGRGRSEREAGVAGEDGADGGEEVLVGEFFVGAFVRPAGVDAEFVEALEPVGGLFDGLGGRRIGFCTGLSGVLFMNAAAQPARDKDIRWSTEGGKPGPGWSRLVRITLLADHELISNRPDCLA